MKRFPGVLIASLAVVGAAAILNRTNASDKAAPTFAKDVAPIIFNKCATCHRPGEAVPMSLTSYQEVRPWAKAVKEQIIEHTMPPWYADPASSLKFRNDRRLSQKEIDTIVTWVDTGSPKGDDADLPALPKFAKGWSWGEPDLIIPMPVEFEVPAEGELPMQNFYVAVPFKEDRWVEAVELRPGNSAVVHHSIANVTRLPEGSRIVNGRAVRAELNTSDASRTGGLREGAEVFQSQDSFARAGAFSVNMNGAQDGGGTTNRLEPVEHVSRLKNGSLPSQHIRRVHSHRPSRGHPASSERYPEHRDRRPGQHARLTRTHAEYHFTEDAADGHAAGEPNCRTGACQHQRPGKQQQFAAGLYLSSRPTRSRFLTKGNPIDTTDVAG
jgi:mono/diheme cytochrome c family protein